jgi:hypothetical protein
VKSNAPLIPVAWTSFHFFLVGLFVERCWKRRLSRGHVPATAKAYEKLRERYLQQPTTTYLLKSTLDDAPSGVPVARVRVRSRAQRIALGIEEPRPVDVASRLAELRRQAEVLLTSRETEDGQLE